MRVKGGRRNEVRIEGGRGERLGRKRQRRVAHTQAVQMARRTEEDNEKDK